MQERMHLKRRHIVLIALMFCALLGCTNHRDGTQKAAEEVVTSPKINAVAPLDTRLLEGVWWSDPEDIHALFFIDGDSLYYVEEQDQPFFMIVRDGMLSMARDSGVFRFEVKKLTEDSLILFNAEMNRLTKLYKSKE